MQGVYAIGLFDCCRVVMQSSDSEIECLDIKSTDKLLESANVMTVYRDDISHEQRQTMDSDLEDGLSQQFMRKCTCPERSSMAQDFLT